MWGERCGRVHEVNKEVCWGVGGGQGSCGKRYGGVWGEVRKDVWGVEKCGEGVGKCMGRVGKCIGVWGKDVGRVMGKDVGRVMGIRCMKVWRSYHVAKLLATRELTHNLVSTNISSGINMLYVMGPFEVSVNIHTKIFYCLTTVTE